MTDPRQQLLGQNVLFQSSPIQSQYVTICHIIKQIQSPQIGQPGIQQQLSPNYQNQIIQSPQQYQQQYGQYTQQYQQNAQAVQYQPQQLSPIAQQSQQILPVTSQAVISTRPSYQYAQPAQQQVYVQPQQQVYVQPWQQVVVQQQAPVIVQSQTQVQEFRHVERPMQVITVDEIEAPWRLKCATLERQILELQIQIRKNNGTIIEESVKEVQDDTKVKNLELQRLELEQKIHDDEQLMNELRQRLEELRSEYEVIITEKISYASNEVETWMKKYATLEKTYADAQNKIADLKRQLAQVEAQDRASQEQKKTEVRSEVRRSSKMY